MLIKLYNKILGKLLGTGVSKYIPFSNQIYDFLYSRFNKAELVEVSIPEGKKLKVWSNDSGFGAFLIHKGVYEPLQTELMLDIARNKGLFLDIGANAGYYTSILSGRVKDVISFEPSKENFELLSKNVELNNLKNVTIEKLALGEQEGLLKFKDDKKQKGHSSLVKEGNFDYEVHVNTLDNYISKNKVNPEVIKVDIEGAEVAFLRGGKDYLSKTEDLLLFIEYHPENIRNLGYEPVEMLELLKEYGFEIEIINEGKGIIEDFSDENLREVVDKYGYTNFYCHKQL